MSVDYNNIPVVSQPVNLSKKLYRHQLASIYKMEKLETEQMIFSDNYSKQTRLGINADPTGYGKTLSMIGLLCRDKMEWDMDKPFVEEIINSQSSNLIKKIQIKRYDKLPTTLILLSTSIIKQWMDELNLTDLKVGLVSKNSQVENIQIKDYDVVICSSSMYNKLMICYPDFAWKRFIFDEPGHLKVANMKKINAGFYWLITATPELIQYYHEKCKNSFIHNIMTEFLINNYRITFNEFFKDIIIKNDRAFIENSVNNIPETYHYYYKCYLPILNAISGLVNSSVEGMVEAGDIEGAIQALGGNKTNNIIELIKDKKIKKINSLDITITVFESFNTDIEQIEKLRKEREKIITEIGEIEKRFNDIINNNCSICTEPIENAIMEPNCQNLFCGKCLLTWLKNKKTCPLCRININPKKLIYIDSKNKDTPKLHKNNNYFSPLEQVIDIITKNKNGKFIIFSSYDNTFKPICRILQENNILYTTLKGNINTRNKSIDNFKQGIISVILLNSTCNGAGINLQESTDIILYHKMEDCMEKQIIGRANRIGRTNFLNVHHIETK